MHVEDHDNDADDGDDVDVVVKAMGTVIHRSASKFSSNSCCAVDSRELF